MIRCVVAARGARQTSEVSGTSEVSAPDSISSFLSSSHRPPTQRQLQAGFALDFHSSTKAQTGTAAALAILSIASNMKRMHPCCPSLLNIRSNFWHHTLK